jgi:hypothetical protein
MQAGSTLVAAKGRARPAFLHSGAVISALPMAHLVLPGHLPSRRVLPACALYRLRGEQFTAGCGQSHGGGQ